MRYGDFCAHNNDNTTDYFIPCVCARGNYIATVVNTLIGKYIIM